MAEIECVPVEHWHVDHIAAAMRQADVDEVRELGGLTARAALDVSLAQPGRAWTGLIDGEPAGIFGVVPVTVMGGTGVVWLLGTPAIQRHWRAVAKVSRPILNLLLEHYDVLLNVTHADNRLALRWLAWLGATFKRNGQRVFFEIRK